MIIKIDLSDMPEMQQIKDGVREGLAERLTGMDLAEAMACGLDVDGLSGDAVELIMIGIKFAGEMVGDLDFDY